MLPVFREKKTHQASFLKFLIAPIRKQKTIHFQLIKAPLHLSC